MWFFQSIVLWSLQRGKRTSPSPLPKVSNRDKLGEDGRRLLGTNFIFVLVPEQGFPNYHWLCIYADFRYLSSITLYGLISSINIQIRSLETPVSKPLPVCRLCVFICRSVCLPSIFFLLRPLCRVRNWVVRVRENLYTSFFRSAWTGEGELKNKSKFTDPNYPISEPAPLSSLTEKCLICC